jgi:hypothetical protein
MDVTPPESGMPSSGRTTFSQRRRRSRDPFYERQGAQLSPEQHTSDEITVAARRHRRSVDIHRGVGHGYG